VKSKNKRIKREKGNNSKFITGEGREEQDEQKTIIKKERRKQWLIEGRRT